MVIGLLAIAAIPTVTGVGQGISVQKKQNAAAKEQEKFHLTAMMPMDGELREAAFCVLLDGKIYLDFPEKPVEGHKFCGHYFTYPGEEKHLGLVSTIMDDPPMLNWIFVDKDTGQLRYGGRKDTLEHVIGPWGWSADEHFLVLEEHAGNFVTKRDKSERDEETGKRVGGRRWSVYWDPEKKLKGAQPLRLRRRLLLGVESQYVRQ